MATATQTERKAIPVIARLYRPRTEILNGAWKFPEPQPLN